MKLWNPVTFFTSMMMSFIMPAIFGLPRGMPVKALFQLWPARWITSYLLLTFITTPIGLGLAEKKFNFNPNRDKTGIWNPALFFTSLMMTFIMPSIFALPKGMSIKVLLLLWPFRWITSYLLLNFLINPIGFRLAKKVFRFDPLAQ